MIALARKNRHFIKNCDQTTADGDLITIDSI